MEEQCVEKDLRLSCADGQSIRVRDILWVDSECHRPNCCPKSRDWCKHSASHDHFVHVESRCNSQSTCTVRAEVKKNWCGCCLNINNDYERISYDCVGEFRTPVIFFMAIMPLRSLIQRPERWQWWCCCCFCCWWWRLWW